MSVLVRAIVLAGLMVAAVTPFASAEGDTCVTMRVQEYASGLQIIAQTGSVIALGFASGSPGDGIGYILYIAPALCAGAGPPPLGLGQQDLQGVRETLPLPDPIPLP